MCVAGAGTEAPTALASAAWSQGWRISRKPGNSPSPGQTGHPRKLKEAGGGGAGGGHRGSHAAPTASCLPGSHCIWSGDAGRPGRRGSPAPLRCLMTPAGSSASCSSKAKFPPWAGGQVSPHSPHFLPRLGSAPTACQQPLTWPSCQALDPQTWPAARPAQASKQGRRSRRRAPAGRRLPHGTRPKGCDRGPGT